MVSKYGNLLCIKGGRQLLKMVRYVTRYFSTVKISHLGLEIGFCGALSYYIT